MKNRNIVVRKFQFLNNFLMKKAVLQAESRQTEGLQTARLVSDFSPREPTGFPNKSNMFPVIFFFTFGLWLQPLPLFSIDWPSASGTIRKNFGLNDQGLPHLGVTFDTDEQLKAADTGEIFFSRREGDSASRLPSPLGVWTALDHGDGIVSIYARMDDKNQKAIVNLAEKGSVLGEAGISGWTNRKGIYFQLFDRKERRWLNPALIITPPEDQRPPEVMSVRLKNAEGQLINPYQTYNISQGRYTIIVNAIDAMRSSGENPLAPYRIMCSLNGSEAGVLTFETFSARDGRLMVYRNGLVPVKQIYSPVPAYEVADVWFSRGQTTLEIIAQDIAGNVRNVVYRLMVE